jgi:hypothetical protein
MLEICGFAYGLKPHNVKVFFFVVLIMPLCLRWWWQIRKGSMKLWRSMGLI